MSEQLQRLAEIGVTDFLAVPYAVGSAGNESLERTRALLVTIAARQPS